MQHQENYFNSTLLPAAIGGDCEVNFKEIQEEMIYAPNDKKKDLGFLNLSPMKSILESTH